MDVVVPNVRLSGSGRLRVMHYSRVMKPQLVVQVLDKTLIRTPTSVTAVVAEGHPNRMVDFLIDDDVVWTAQLDTDGFLGPTSVEVNGGGSGTRTLTVRQAGALSASDTFRVMHGSADRPIARGPDAQAVDILEANRPDGSRAWVLQDLTPGGLGSYVMPLNPRTMSNPHLEYTFTTFETTAPISEYGRGGQFHVMQGGPTPKEWTFEGYCPTRDMHDMLLKYLRLNRRFYVIDHRKRAWKVVFTNIDFVARLQQLWDDHRDNEPLAKPTDWGHDYTVTATVLDQRWVTPAKPRVRLESHLSTSGTVATP